MENILIDTCSWIDILSHEEENIQLENIRHWISNEEIQLYTHEHIINEWEKHKKRQLNIFKQSITTKYKHANEIFRKQNISSNLNLQPDFNHIESQIKIIDELLEKAQLLETSIRVKALASDRSIQKLPPFHKKLDSQKDAHIIFSALEHFDELEQHFWFLSSNKNDFGDPNKGETDIHSSIQEGFLKCKIIYFADIKRAIYQLSNKLSSSLLPKRIDRAQTSQSDEFEIDSSLLPAKQLYQYVLLRRKQLKFTPTHIFTSHYPFKINKKLSYYSNFTVVTENRELINNLKEFLSENSNESVDLSRYLYENLIHNIELQGGKQDEKILIPTPEGDPNSAKAYVISFNYLQAINLLETPSNTSSEFLEKAYCQYLLGDYLKCHRTLENILNNTSDEDDATTKFIANFNLNKLSVFIRSSYFDQFDELIDELNSIDLYDKSRFYSSRENKRVLEWIRDKSFINSATERINELVEKISSQYNSSLKGAWSNNSHVSLLLAEYAHLLQFLEFNNIIYDSFQEFSDLSQIFFKGLIISHSIPEAGGSRFEALNDWILNKMILYGESEKILKYCNHYEVSRLRYAPDKKNYLKLWMENYFQIKEDFEKILDSYLEPKNLSFWESYNKIFENFITVYSILDLGEDDINSFASSLLDFLNKSSKIYPSSLMKVAVFIEYRYQLLDNKNLNQFLDLIIYNGKYHNNAFFQSIGDAFRNRELSVIINDEVLNFLLEMSFGECPKCSKRHSNTLGLYILRNIKDESQKSTISKRITKEIDDKFDFQLFCLAAIFDFLEIKNSYWDRALEYCHPSKKAKSFREFFSGKEDKQLYNFNQLMNVAFKQGHSFNSVQLRPFQKFDSYYDWLCDPKNFNYNLFDPLWITVHRTKFFARHIFGSKKTKSAVEKSLKTNLNQKLQRTYIDIFIRKSWAD